MSGEGLGRAERVYFEVASLARDEREAALRRACEGDTALLSEVRELLAAGESLGEFLESPPLGTDFLLLASPSIDGGLPDDLVGRRVGRYLVQKRIASGGMGTVYEASRDDDFHQRVALKVVKRGMDSEEILRRFRAERQTLAALNHPNIARLLDGGATPDGRPYLVMEYVEGRPIDAFCDEKRMAIPERLRLFQRVCEAVSSAHQALVVHRDIKPGNILVTSDGTPKLLDFGIAKVMEGNAVGVTITSVDQRRLTPEYASPEQVRGESINTASDVYSLGVVLYELLTGARPYLFKTRSMSEIEKVVCFAPPTPPSVAVPRMTAAGAETRGATPERLSRRLRGDLDTIVLAAMQKEASRRYASVEALAADIGRYLEGMPIAAQKDTVVYRVSKFVRRNVLGTALTTAAVVCLVAGTAIASWQAERASSQRDQAYQARDDAEAIAAFLQRTLEAADIMQAGRDVLVVDIVDGAAARLEADLGDRPLTKAAVQSAIGRAFVALGEYERAEMHITTAYELRKGLLPAGHHDLAESMMDVALLYHATSRPKEAEAELREALRIHQGLRGVQNLDTARVWNDLGAVLRVQGRFDEAEAAHTEALAARITMSGRESLVVAESLNNLSGVYMGKKDLARAEETMSEARAIRARLLRPDHALVVQATHNLGTIIATRGDYARAEPLLREALAGTREAYPDRHPAVASVLTSLGNCLTAEGKGPEAEPFLREAVQIRREKLLPTDAQRVFSEVSLGRTLHRLGRDAEAADMLAASLTMVRPPEGAISGRWAEGVRDLAEALDAQGRADEAATWRLVLPK